MIGVETARPLSHLHKGCLLSVLWIPHSRATIGRHLGTGPVPLDLCFPVLAQLAPASRNAEDTASVRRGVQKHPAHGPSIVFHEALAECTLRLQHRQRQYLRFVANELFLFRGDSRWAEFLATRETTSDLSRRMPRSSICTKSVANSSAYACESPLSNAVRPAAISARKVVLRSSWFVACPCSDDATQTAPIRNRMTSGMDRRFIR